MGGATEKRQYPYVLGLLILGAIVLIGKLVYLCLDDTHRFPIKKIKIVSTAKSMQRSVLEEVISKHVVAHSFFTLHVEELRADLRSLPWVKAVNIQRNWPSSLRISLIEKTPIVYWNDKILTEEGELVDITTVNNNIPLPKLYGPGGEQSKVLQIYRKISKILMLCNVQIAGLKKSNNQSWEVLLTNGVQLYLGKHAIITRITRFCKAYPAVFADKITQLVSVDLRYPRGMAVRWRKGK